VSRKKRRPKKQLIQAPASPGPIVIADRPSTFHSKPWWVSNWWNLEPTGRSDDVTCDIGTVGDLAVAAATIRGNTHRHDGNRCEDAFFISTGTTISGRSFLVAVIGDGLGSAKHSSFGSRRATQLFGNHLTASISKTDTPNEETVNTAVDAAFEMTKVKASKWKIGDLSAPPLSPAKVSSADIETTLTFAVVPADPNANKKRTVLIGSVGDSPIFKLSENKWECLTDSDNGDIVDSATRGVHSADRLTTSMVSIADTDVLFLTTDGIGNFISNGANMLAVGTYLADRWRNPVPLHEFINDMTFDLSSADDDRTAIVCWPYRDQYLS
jgi:serine/threonine protein phosphatase PrpC